MAGGPAATGRSASELEQIFCLILEQAAHPAAKGRVDGEQMLQPSKGESQTGFDARQEGARAKTDDVAPLALDRLDERHALALKSKAAGFVEPLAGRGVGLEDLNRRVGKSQERRRDERSKRVARVGQDRIGYHTAGAPERSIDRSGLKTCRERQEEDGRTDGDGRRDLAGLAVHVEQHAQLVPEANQLVVSLCLGQASTRK